AFSEHWHYFMDTERKGDPAFKCHEWTLPEELHLTAFVGNETVDWLSRYDSDRPFLLQVGFLAPHSPTMPPPEFMNQYRDSDEAPPWNAPNPPIWLTEARRGYRAMITHLDAYVGRIRACLAERGLLDNTIFVYTADHGEMAGDHGQSGKTTFYEASVRVPLLFSGPRVAAGQESQALVETIDIGWTLCDLCGVEPHAFENGQSLAPLLRGETISHRNTVYSEMGCDRMLRTERYKLMWGEPTFDKRKLGRLHLDKPVDVPPSPGAIFDLQEDPHETRNLIENRDLHLDLLEQLLARINENTETQPFLSRGEYRPLRPA
ncbi:MAG TPA: sulfatase-like hydrolase/transferase, partial [Chloroflexota bacterium]|nr:sulfatase-like hydrolase/transferase [Chloroflexota bacterium]